MAFSYITTTETLTAEGNRLYPDIKNRWGREFVDAFLEEHNADGTHIADVCQVIRGSYSGTGAAQTVSLSNSAAVIKFLLIWSASHPGVYVASDISTTYTVKSSEVSDTYADFEITLDTGGFDLTADSGDELNENGVTFYYAAWCTGTWVDAAKSNADPPVWVVHGESLLGGAAAMANRCEKKIYDNIYTPEHNDDGTHKAAAFSGVSFVETGSFDGDGTSSQAVTLTDTSLDVKGVFLWEPDTQTPILFQTENMSNIVTLDRTPPISAGALTLGTGSLTVDGTVNGNGVNVLKVSSNTYDGDPVVLNTGIPGGTFLNYGVKHSTTAAHSGASSLKFISNTGFTTNGSTTPRLSLNGDFSLSFWMKTTANDTTYNNLVFFMRGANYQRAGVIICYMSYTGVFQVIKTAFLDSVGSTAAVLSLTITTTTQINDNAWHQVTVSRVSGTVSVLIDGSSEGTPGTWTQENPNVDFAFGLHTLQGGWTWGLVDGILFKEYGYNATGYMDDISIRVTNHIFRDGQTYYYAAIGEH